MRARVAGWRAAVALAAVAAAGEARVETVGFVAHTQGPVEIRTGGSGSFQAAAVDHEVAVGDAIRTGRAGLAKLVLVDDTSITVDEETELAIDRYLVGSAAAGGEPSRVELLAGHVRTKVAERFGGRLRLEMMTPTALIGVKGTEWLTWFRNQVTWVCVVSGMVSAANRDPAILGTLNIAAGRCARIASDRPPESSDAPPFAPVDPTHSEASAPADAPAFHDRQLIETDDQVGRELDVPEPEPQPEPEPEPEDPPSRGNQPPPIP